LRSVIARSDATKQSIVTVVRAVDCFAGSPAVCAIRASKGSRVNAHSFPSRRGAIDRSRLITCIGNTPILTSGIPVARRTAYPYLSPMSFDTDTIQDYHYRQQLVERAIALNQVL
jgi:hypothetical protein